MDVKPDTSFWQSGGFNAKPSQYAHKFIVQRDTFVHGVCKQTDRLEIWMLDARGIDDLVARWNKQPTSTVSGRGYNYQRTYD